VAAFPHQVEGRAILITGPGSGSLSALTATYLAAAKPACIILLGRNLANIRDIIDTISSTSPSVTVHFVPMDLPTQSSVRKAAATVIEKVSKIDVLINNAGIMALPKFQTSKDGIELQFATNHIAHFLLKKLLMPLVLAASPGSRIINLSSAAHVLGEI